jgi:hypothetical protein
MANLFKYAKAFRMIFIYFIHQKSNFLGVFDYLKTNFNPQS